MRKSLLLFMILGLLLSGCTNREIKKEVEDFIKNQEKYVNEKDVEKYMSTISKAQNEYIAEKKSWIRDIEMNKIKEYDLKVVKIKEMDEEKVAVKIKQSYTYEGKKHSITIPLILVKEDGILKDGDLAFEELGTKHFKIKYSKDAKQYAEYIQNVCEEAYYNVFKRYGEGIDDLTTIKLYEDDEILRQSVKLSFSWQFAGWYEYPESIKTTKFDSEEAYRSILEHELIHKITIKKSKNNIPYWFTEGLAVYLANFPNEPKECSQKSYYLDTYKGKSMDILKLEKANLEKMEEDEEISNYYDSSGMIVKFMVETYGLKKVKEIVDVLGKFPYQEGTGLEVDQESIKRFHLVIENVLGINVEDLNRRWKSYLAE